MKHFFIIILMYLITASAVIGQQTVVTDANFAVKINELLDETVDFISVHELSQMDVKNVVVLDAREKEEYNVSHIDEALYIGYKNPDFSILNQIEKDTPLVIYCSIGYRSEKIGEKLKELGFNSVRNLYGSIFEWVNQGHSVVNIKGEPTSEIHCYNKKWSKWMINEAYQKVW